MEVLNSHERQGKTVGEIEGSYKMMGLSILFVGNDGLFQPYQVFR
jgi:hypothetical protein